MSLFSRLRAVVSGDDYLDGEYDDELDYDPGDVAEPSPSSRSFGSGSSSSALALSEPFGGDDPFAGTNVIGTYTAGWTQYRITHNFANQTITVSKRAAATDSWTQLKSAGASGYDIPMRGSGTVTKTGGLYCWPATASKQP